MKSTSKSDSQTVLRSMATPILAVSSRRMLFDQIVTRHKRASFELSLGPLSSGFEERSCSRMAAGAFDTSSTLMPLPDSALARYRVCGAWATRSRCVVITTSGCMSVHVSAVVYRISEVSRI
jgi:hypothetical protein